MWTFSKITHISVILILSKAATNCLHFQFMMKMEYLIKFVLQFLLEQTSGLVRTQIEV